MALSLRQRLKPCFRTSHRLQDLGARKRKEDKLAIALSDEVAFIKFKCTFILASEACAVPVPLLPFCLLYIPIF